MIYLEYKLSNMKYIASLILLFSLFSCNSIDLQVADTNVPVVECYLNPSEEISIKVVKQLTYSSDDTINSYINNLSILVFDDENYYDLNNTGEGIYTNSEVIISSSKEYHLAFTYNEKEVSAETIIPNKPIDFSASATTIEIVSFSDFTPGSGTPPERPDPTTLTWSNDSNMYHMIVVECIEEDTVLITESTDRPPRQFRNMPTLNTSQEIEQMNFSYYGSHQIILYQLNTEYAALYEQLGTSSLDITAPPSNVENGLGIFTGINSDTLFVNVVAQ